MFHLESSLINTTVADKAFPGVVFQSTENFLFDQRPFFPNEDIFVTLTIVSVTLIQVKKLNIVVCNVQRLSSLFQS